MAPSESDWETHKSLIQSLYLSATLKEMMKRMEEDHQFIASKMQYTNRLKNWGSRKYLSKEETDYALHRKRKREKDGKESEVIWLDVVIPAEKLRKAASRASISDLNNLDFLNPPTPEGMVVRTPPPTGQDSIETFASQGSEAFESVPPTPNHTFRMATPDSGILQYPGITETAEELETITPGARAISKHQWTERKAAQTCCPPSYSADSPQYLVRVDLGWLWCKFQTLPMSSNLFANYRSENEDIHTKYLDSIYERSYLEVTPSAAVYRFSSQNCAKIAEALSEEGQQSPFDLYFLSYLLDGI